MGNARPRARYAVGCLALLACVLTPMLDVILLLASQSTPVFAKVRKPFAGMAAGTRIHAGEPSLARLLDCWDR